jgi:hypothetical protein
METVRYKMKPMTVNTIEININLQDIDVKNIDVYSINDNSDDILLENNVDYKFEYLNNKTFFTNITNKPIRRITITRNTYINKIINEFNARYKDSTGQTIAYFNNEGNQLIYHIGFPDRRR